MKLSEICVRQPVFATVLSLFFLVLGVIGFQQLEMRFFPRLRIPVVHVGTSYQGASPSLMEKKVTTPIENSLAGIDNIQYMTSSSGTSSSSITVQFRLGGDLEKEAAQVRDKIAAIKQDLPADANMPSVSVGNAGGVIVGMTFVDPQMKPQDMREYLISHVSPVLRQLKGVAGVGVYGSTGYALRVWLDSDKMAARGVTVADIKSAISANNLYFPAGAFRGKEKNYGIISDTRLKNIDQFRRIIIKKGAHSVVRLSDVAKVDLGMQGFYDLPMHIGTHTGLAIQVSPLATANPIAVAHRVIHAFNQLKPTLPHTMQAQVLFDNSRFLEGSIHETFMAIFEAIILVVLVVILFLGSFRAASVVIVTIPISLMAVFFVIKLMGFTLNVMTLLAMVLAIGLVVDDAIVMLENIHRHIEKGLSRFQAAIVGSREIAYPIIVMAVTLVSVYVPVGFSNGFTARLFQQFAFTLASAVAVSAFIALTLSPMMCSRVLASGEPTRWAVGVDSFFQFLTSIYQRFLQKCIQYRRRLLVILLCVAGLGYFIFSQLHSEIIPKEDYGRIEIGITPPGGSTLQYTEKYAKSIMQKLRTIPDIKQTMFQMSGGYIGISCYLKPWGQRHETSTAIAQNMNRWLHQIPGVNANASVTDLVSVGSGGSGVTINFTTTGEYQSLMPAINRMLNLLKHYPGVESPGASLHFDSQQYAIQVHRDVASQLGVNITDIADTVQVMMSGVHWTDLQSGTHSYPVMLQMKKSDLMSFNSLNHIYVPSSISPTVVSVGQNPPTVNMIPLSSLISLVPRVGQSSLQHFQRDRSGYVSAAIAPGYTESQVIQFINQHLPKILKAKPKAVSVSVSSQKQVSQLPSRSMAVVKAQYSGAAADYMQSSGSMLKIFILSFVFIYLVLSAQFGSFIDPFIILFAVPLSMVGALLALWVSGGTFSLYSQIGIVTLVGLISKHGILITKFINDLRERGVPFMQAIVDGASIRLRPVLMTTVAMIFGALPLIFTQGPGSVGRHQIGWTVIGGLFFGTFFSLIVVPISYTYLGRFKRVKKVEQLPE